jgi:hypothetical protein
MQRYEQKFGSLGPMIKSETGNWIQEEEVLEQLKLMEERNTEIEQLKKSHISELKKSHISELERQEQNFLDWIEKADKMIKELGEEQIFLKEIQSNLQHFGDDNEELLLKNSKLFSLLVISTVLNLLAGSTIVLFLLGFLTI